MILIHNIRFKTVLGVILLMTQMMFAVACSKDSDGGGGDEGDQVRFDPALTVKPNQSGIMVIQISGEAGAQWTAQIVSGDSWTSFSPTSKVTTKSGVYDGTSATREIAVHYTGNNTDKDRYAQISFTFAGQAPVALDMVQYSLTGQENVYDLGQNNFWPEIPAKSAANYIYVTHFCPVRNTSNNTTFNGRNYTLCFDKTKRGSWWVAYPVHAAYLGSGRPSPDPWAFDPKIDPTFQANLGRGSYGSGYDRGHQCPNADRNADPYGLMCYQTFYASNATPQNSSLNQQPWARLEGKVRDWKCSDTLYVVTGAYWAPNNNTSTTDRDGNRCPVPDNYFKVVVRTVQGNIRQRGDKLGNYQANQLQAIGFWVKNASGQGEAVNWATSVSDIESKTGFTFFPTIPAAVKQQNNPGAWGL